MKRNLTVLLLEICSIICCYAQVSIKRDYKKMDIWTQNPFVISNDMESNKSFNTLLGRYLHLSMTNESTDTLNKDSLSILFSRPSFKELVKFMLIKDREDLNVFYPESHETWDDYKINLLYNCTDTTVLYSIANDLLLNKNVLGLLGIWNNCRVSKLPAYRQFVKWCCEKRQQEIIVMLVIINHNNGNIMEEKRLLKYAKKIQFISKTTFLIAKETHNKLLRLLYYVSMIIEDTESFENGFVNNYWYDADGERMVRTSGEHEAIYVEYRASRVQN